MRKIFVIGWLLLLAGFALADCPIKMASEKLGVFLKSPLDSAGIDVEVPDSVWVQVWADNGTATRYEARSTTAPFSDIGLDTSLALFAGLTNLKYVYNPLISDIDGTAGNFQLSGAVTLFTKKIPTTTSFCVQVVADSLSKTVSLVSAYLNATISSRSTFSVSTDSVKPSGTVLAGLNNIIKTNSFGAGAIDDNAVADGAIDFGGELDTAGLGAGVAGGDGMTLAEFDSATATWAGPDSVVYLVWNYATRKLTAIDEDEMTIDLNGTAVGSVVGKVTLVDSSANDIAMLGNAHPTDSARILKASTAADSINAHAPHANNWGGTGGGGSGTDYPIAGLTFVVDAVGADGNSQFVADTASLGPFSSNQNTLINRAVIIRSLSGGAVQLPTTITRVAYAGANCSLTVSIDAPKNFAASDTIQLTGLPWHDFATLSEASDSGAIAILEADTTGHGADNTVGKSLQTGGAGGSDSTVIKAMLQNNQVLDAADSTLKLAQTSTGAGGLRRGELASKAEIVDSTKKTPLIIGTNNDKVNYTLSSAGIDAIWDEPKAGHTTAGTYGYYVDAAISGVSGGGGSCAGTGSDTTDIFVFAASDSDQFVGVWVNLFVGAERFAVQTDPNGRARFAIDGSGSYTAIVSARPFTHDDALVALGTVDTIWMEQSDESPTLTPVCGTLRTLQGQPIMGATVIARNQATSVRVGNQTVSPYITSVPTDQFGRFTLWLYPTATLGGTSYKYNLTAYRGSTLIESVSSITVPDQSTCYEIDWSIN